MFETTENMLMLSGMYVQIGFVLGILYNLMRFIRLSFPGMKIMSVISDFLFMLVCGAVLFVFSVEYGTGFFRLYYVAAAALGFALNMLTIGFAVPPLAGLFRKIYTFFGRKLAVPFRAICQKSASVFGKIAEKTTYLFKMCKMRLQMNKRMMYNKNNHKIGAVYQKSGENRNVIKAKVVKKG